MLFLALAALLCGCEGIRIAGGTSEVGNPVSILPAHGAVDTTRTRVTGIGISSQGPPIRLLREDGEDGEPSEAARTAPDSIPVP